MPKVRNVWLIQTKGRGNTLPVCWGGGGGGGVTIRTTGEKAFLSVNSAVTPVEVLV
jgi:hypothetical protein